MERRPPQPVETGGDGAPDRLLFGAGRRSSGSFLLDNSTTAEGDGQHRPETQTASPLAQLS
jgi:hypothetical protein